MSEIERGRWVRCRSCDAVYHEGCWQENGGCITGGCKSNPRTSEGSQQAVPASPAESIAGIFRFHLQKGPTDFCYVAPHIPPDKLVRALSSFAHLAPNEKPLMLLDGAFLCRPCKHGTMFTDRGVHFESSTGRGRLALPRSHYGPPRFLSYDDLDAVVLWSPSKVLDLKSRNGEEYHLLNCCGNEVREAVVAAYADIKKFIANPRAGIPGGRYAPAPDAVRSETKLGRKR